MNPQPAPAPVLVSNKKQSEADTQLHGHWPVLAWLVWLAVVVPIAFPFLFEYFFLCIPLSIGAALLGSRLWKKHRDQE